MKNVLLAALVAAVAASAAGARTTATPGVTASTITLGGSVPLSGIASGYKSVAIGADAYFKYVNERGGVDGRKIQYKYLDDEYDPSKALQAARQLVEQDNVFAIFNTLGTENNLAIRDYLKQRGVPQLFVAAGASAFGHDSNSIGYLPSYVSEGKIYGRYIAAKMPKAKIAILYQDDAYTQDLINGFNKGLGTKKKQVVAKAGYDVTATDVASQIAKLKSSGANTLMIFATPKYAISSYISANKLGWKPKIFINQVSSASSTMLIAAANSGTLTEGSISTVTFKDPESDAAKNDKGIKLYRQIMAKYAKGSTAADVYNVYAMAVAYTMVDALKHAGKNPTRKSIWNAVLHLNEKGNPFLLNGIVVKTSPKDHFPIEQAQLEIWRGGKWVPLGKLVAASS